MSDVFEPIQIPEMGLSCDNQSCDWKDTTILSENYKSYVNTPCPKCGENILTEEDYMTSVQFQIQTELFNNALSLMSAEERNEVYKSIEDEYTAAGLELPTSISVKIHNGINIHIGNNTDSKE